ncbi:MAG TPA: hypothetical protein VGU71_22460 [Candidatus Dormibacteraeota bacterium]|nr:hypothetical protein [Candidatus Dormibacteraeota bacterium]
MARHTVELTRVERVAESALFVLGGEQIALSKELRLMHLLEGLEEADRLELADAQGQHEQAIVHLKATQARLAEVTHRCGQKQAIRARICELIKLEQTAVGDGIKEVSGVAHEVGFMYARPEHLVGKV